MMRILIDNNVVIDALAERDEGSADSMKLLELICLSECKAYVATKSITDIHYTLTKIFRKLTMAANSECDLRARSAIGSYLCIVALADTTGADVEAAFSSPMADFEDSVIAAVASSYNVDYIITCNLKDYENSPVKAICPHEAIELLQSLSSEQPAQELAKTPITSYFAK